jgi:hypothetical protein
MMALLLTAAVWLTTGVAAQDDDEESPYRPGLIATYSDGDSSATRIDESVAFDWQAAAPDPRLPAGEFNRGRWRGIAVDIGR